jgi:tetratricopeptide (TPR) repeat protein
LGAWTVFGIVALAFGLRLLHLQGIQILPTFEDPIIDARSYHEWAQRIAAGDWWGDRVFYQAPAYPYFLALVYSLPGPDLLTAHVAQALLGALGCGLLSLATTLFLGRGAGIAAGLLLALYPPAIFFDGIIQKACLASFLLVLLLFLLALLQTRPGAGRAALAGGVLALLCLTRENALVFAVVIVPWILLGPLEGSRSLRARWSAAFLAGLLLPLLLVGARNQLVGGTFSLTTSQLGPNFYIGNNPEATGIYRPLVPGRETPEHEGPDAVRLAEEALGRTLDAGEVSEYWLARSLAFIRSEPLRWLGMLGQKAFLTFHRFEVPDAEDLYLHSDYSRVLRILSSVLDFSIVLALAGAGAVFAWRRKMRVGILVALAATFAATVILFYVFARYRYPLVLLLIPFAGLGLYEALGHAWRRQAAGLLAPALVAAGLLLFARVPILNEAPLRASSYFNLGELMLQQGRRAEAEHNLVRAEAIFPDSAELQLRLALLRAEAGRLAEAEAHARRAVALQAEDPRGYRVLARVLRRQGRALEAQRQRLRARHLESRREPEAK